jgi:hypothetical protein
MTDEAEFRKYVLIKIGEAQKLTGHTFYGLRTAIREDGAIATARRLIDSQGDTKFQFGMRELKKEGLLRLSVEQAIIDFDERGEVFNADEVRAAKERLAIAELVL